MIFESVIDVKDVHRKIIIYNYTCKKGIHNIKNSKKYTIDKPYKKKSTKIKSSKKIFL